MERWQTTMRVYDEYERRFAQARAAKPLRFPTDPETRARVRAEVRAVLGYDEALVPAVRNVETVSRQDFPGYRVEQLRYETWERVYGTASLYLPEADGPLPLVFVLCGHGEQGRLTEGYRRMAHRLAALGAAVLCPDNIGQGDRAPMGHRDAFGPFYAGLTLQGMIVMETVALIRHFRADPRFDPNRLGSCGNSGGGTLNVFLAALAPELTALSASGYPSEFPYILAKERRHCACNLLPGIAKGPEMWEVLSLFAPRPLLLEQGSGDALIPVDLAWRNQRKTDYVYREMGAQENFRFVLTPTSHSWTPEDRYEIARFLTEALDAAPPTDEDGDDALSYAPESWQVPLPPDARSTDEAAGFITGRAVPAGLALEDVFPPRFEGKRLDPETIEADIGRGPVMRVLAQMECTLEDGRQRAAGKGRE